MIHMGRTKGHSNSKLKPEESFGSKLFKTYHGDKFTEEVNSLVIDWYDFKREKWQLRGIALKLSRDRIISARRSYKRTWRKFYDQQRIAKQKNLPIPTEPTARDQEAFDYIRRKENLTLWRDRLERETLDKWSKAIDRKNVSFFENVAKAVDLHSQMKPLDKGRHEFLRFVGEGPTSNKSIKDVQKHLQDCRYQVGIRRIRGWISEHGIKLKASKRERIHRVVHRKCAF